LVPIRFSRHSVSCSIDGSGLLYASYTELDDEQRSSGAAKLGRLIGSLCRFDTLSPRLEEARWLVGICGPCVGRRVRQCLAWECQFANMATTATTSIVRFRSAMITVFVVIDCLRCYRRIVSIESLSHLLVRAAGRCGPVPGIRSCCARRCKS
jgi:hypothetical protein